MTFNQDTYMHDLLQLFGWINIFSHRQRRYPIEADLGLCEAEDSSGKDTRYPHITRGEIVAGNPEIILLPSEPFKFEEQHRLSFIDQFYETQAVRTSQVILIDGSLLTWHGTRLGKALVEFGALLNFL